jgi:hypothetical protein
MFTVEEDSGTYTGSLRRHDGYYAGDFSRNPMCTAGELSELAGSSPRPSRSRPGMPTDPQVGPISRYLASLTRHLAAGVVVGCLPGRRLRDSRSGHGRVGGGDGPDHTAAEGAAPP